MLESVHLSQIMNPFVIMIYMERAIIKERNIFLLSNFCVFIVYSTNQPQDSFV